jgi:hypothetical protein
MMRKRFFMILCAIMISTSLLAWEKISFTTSINDDIRPIGNGHPRSPEESPVVYIEDYTLLFESGHSGYTIRLLDADDVVVFSDVLSAETTTFQLPTTLAGEYQIQLIYGNIIFVGYIEL